VRVRIRVGVGAPLRPSRRLLLAGYQWLRGSPAGLVALALAVGVGAGLGAIAFRYLILGFTRLLSGHGDYSAASPAHAANPLVPWLGPSLRSRLHVRCSATGKDAAATRNRAPLPTFPTARRLVLRQPASAEPNKRGVTVPRFPVLVPSTQGPPAWRGDRPGVAGLVRESRQQPHRHRARRARHPDLGTFDAETRLGGYSLVTAEDMDGAAALAAMPSGLLL
jgi:hypothetical protein